MIDIENMKKLLSQVKAELLGGCQEDYNAKMNAEYIAPLEEALTELERLQEKEIVEATLTEVSNVMSTSERKIRAYEEIIGYLVTTKEMYGNKKGLHKSAYALSDAINLIWKEMKLHCHTIKYENGLADVDMKFKDIINMYLQARPAEKD